MAAAPVRDRGPHRPRCPRSPHGGAHLGGGEVPLPDPPAVRLPLMDVGVAILTLAERYAEAPLTQKRLLHNDMVLVVNTSCSSS